MKETDVRCVAHDAKTVNNETLLQHFFHQLNIMANEQGC